MEELELPIEVLKNTEEEDVLTVKTESTNHREARVIEKYDAYDDHLANKWRIGKFPNDNSPHFLVFEEARVLLKTEDLNGFLSHNGDPVTYLKNHDKEIYAEFN